MQVFELENLISSRAASAQPYLEFLRIPDLSMGLYELPAGGTDAQSPHQQDEVYYVVSGTARIKVGDEDRPVKPGSLIYVPKNIEHRFHSIEVDLILLVFFAPAESTNKPGPTGV
jgi:mannose-6-phosphate isomerase-like protein (cupin superfamily)